MKLFFVLAMLLSHLERAISDGSVVTIPLISKTNLDSFLVNPIGIWADARGNVFVSTVDEANYNKNHVYKQSTDGTVSLFAGKEGNHAFSGDGGLATEASLAFPRGIWGDSDNLYICDYINGRVRAVNFVNNEITTIIGGGKGYQMGTEPQPAKEISFYPLSIWGDGKGNLYILTDRELVLYSIAKKTIQLIAYSDSGAEKTGADGKPDLARPGSLLHLTGDASRNCLYISEESDSEYNPSAIVRKLDLTSKTATVFAGTYGKTSLEQYTDGTKATKIKFSSAEPTGLWAADDGTVFVSDPRTQSISAINPNTNEIHWVAGKWNDLGLVDQDSGSPKLGKIYPSYLTGNSQLNTLYVTSDLHTIRKISPLFTGKELAPSSKVPKGNLRGSV
jgi:hypothetical protein